MLWKVQKKNCEKYKIKLQYNLIQNEFSEMYKIKLLYNSIWFKAALKQRGKRCSNLINVHECRKGHLQKTLTMITVVLLKYKQMFFFFFFFNFLTS